MSPRGIAEVVRAIVREEVRRLRGQVLGSIARAVLTQLSTDGGTPRATVGLRADEARDDVEVLEPYGFTSAPAAGAEGVALMVGGDAAHHVVLALGDRQLRLKNLKSGEVAVYAQDGQVVLLKENGDVIITPAPGGGVYLGDAEASKRVALAEDVDARLASLQTAHDTHVHPGVTAGPGSTAVTLSIVGPLDSVAATNVYAKG